MQLPEYKPHKDKDKRIKSAITAIKALVALDLYPAHKKNFLSNCIWKITVADGTHKHKIRFRSIESLEKDKDLRHDHVYTKKSLH